MRARERQVFRVVATYDTYEWKRRYFTRAAAEVCAQRRREGWTHEAIRWDEDDVVQEPAKSVRIEVAAISDWTEL